MNIFPPKNKYIGINPFSDCKGGLPIFRTEELKRLVPLFLFFSFYSLLFILWQQTFFYTLPIVLGLLIAILIQPIISFLEKKCRISHTIATLTTVIFILLFLLAALAFLGIYAVREISAFIANLSSGGWEDFSQPVTDFLNEIGSFLQKIDLDFLDDNRETVLQVIQSSMNLILGCLGTVLKVITSLPLIITMWFVIAFSTFFFARDMAGISRWIHRFFSEKLIRHVKSAKTNSESMGRKYLLSYLFLYFITFCEACIILTILDVSYPLTISLMTAIADVLPVFGPGIVFLPLSIYQLLVGNYSCAAGLVIGWLIITCIRQVVEPKLISSTVKVHPLGMMAAVYFSLVAGNMWVLLYIAGLLTLYSTFRQTGALPSLIKTDSASEK